MIKKLLNTKISKENKKGFTLAELLIVVAIIGVLVAVSIPIFTSQLEKSRDATSVANMRSAYAEAVSSLLTETASNDNVNLIKTGNAITSIAVKGVMIQTAQDNNWSNGADKLPFTAPADPGGISSSTDYTITFTVEDGQLVTTTAPTLAATA